jgi:tetratricopeptide (TPR) repeat protein
MPRLAYFSLIALMVVTVAGCRLPGFRGPVPASLEASRQATQRGIEAMERGQAKEAEAKLYEAVKACPTNPEARRYYAETLNHRGARAEAIAQLEEAARLSPDSAEVRLRLAELYFAVGRAEAAASSAEQAIALNPRLPGPWAVRGRVMVSTGDLPQALADFQRALGYSPDDRQILLDVAEVYRQMDRPQRALETLQQLAETYSPGEEPQNVLYLQGLACLALERHDDAIESLSAAAVRGKSSPEILFRLADAQNRAKRPADATVTLQQALALDPRHQPSRELLTRIEVASRGASGGTMRR